MNGKRRSGGGSPQGFFPGRSPAACGGVLYDVHRAFGTDGMVESSVKFPHSILFLKPLLNRGEVLLSNLWWLYRSGLMALYHRLVLFAMKVWNLCAVIVKKLVKPDGDIWLPILSHEFFYVSSHNLPKVWLINIVRVSGRKHFTNSLHCGNTDLTLAWQNKSNRVNA